MEFSDKTIIVLILLILAGFFLRVNDLGSQSFWIDEAITTNAAIGLIETGEPVFESGFVYDRGILNTILISASMLLFGFSEEAARLPSVIFGVLTIITIYFFTREIAGKKIALLTTLFVTFSTLEIGWSRQARMYQQLQFLYFLSLFLFYKFIKTRKTIYIGLVTLFSIAAFLTHRFAYALILVYLAYLLFVFVKNRYLKQKISLKKTIAKNSVPIIIFLAGTLALVFLTDTVNYILSNNVNYNAAYLDYLFNNFFVFFSLAIVGVIIALKKDLGKSFILITAYLIPFIVISNFVILLHFRYVYFILPIIFVFAAYALIYFYELVEKRFNKKLALGLFSVLVLVLMGFSGLFTFLPEDNYYLGVFTPQPDFKSAYSYLSENIKEGDLVVDTWTVIGKHYRGTSDYWLEFNTTGLKRSSRLVDETHERYANAVTLHTASDLNALLQNNETVWLVVDETAWIKLGPSKKNVIEESFEEQREFKNKFFWVKVYRNLQ